MISLVLWHHANHRVANHKNICWMMMGFNALFLSVFRMIIGIMTSNSHIISKYMKKFISLRNRPFISVNHQLPLKKENIVNVFMTPSSNDLRNLLLSNFNLAKFKKKKHHKREETLIFYWRFYSWIMLV